MSTYFFVGSLRFLGPGDVNRKPVEFRLDGCRAMWAERVPERGA